MLTDFYRYVQPLNARKTSGLCSPVCLGAHKARASIYQKTDSKLKICPLLLSMGPPLVSERECKIKGGGIVWKVSQFPSVFCATNSKAGATEKGAFQFSYNNVVSITKMLSCM